MTLEEQKNKVIPLEKIKSHRLRIGTVTLYKGNILWFDFFDDVSITKDDVIEMSQKNLELTGSEMYLSIVVPGYRNDLTREAREFDFYKAMNRKPTAIAEAVVIKDLPTRIVADFYYKLRKFPYPVKVFSTVEKAFEWFNLIKPNHDKQP